VLLLIDCHQKIDSPYELLAIFGLCGGVKKISYACFFACKEALLNFGSGGWCIYIYIIASRELSFDLSGDLL